MLSSGPGPSSSKHAYASGNSGFERSRSSRSREAVGGAGGRAAEQKCSRRLRRRVGRRQAPRWRSRQAAGRQHAIADQEGGEKRAAQARAAGAEPQGEPDVRPLQRAGEVPRLRALRASPLLFCPALPSARSPAQLTRARRLPFFFTCLRCACLRPPRM